MPDGTLSEKDREKLDGIVQQMIANKESDDNINTVVADFKEKYGLKKKVETTPLDSSKASSTTTSLAPGGSTSASGILPSASPDFENIQGRVDPQTLQPIAQPQQNFVAPVNIPIAPKQKQAIQTPVNETDEIAAQKKIESEMDLRLPTEEELQNLKLTAPTTFTGYSPLGKRRTEDFSGTMKKGPAGIPSIQTININDSYDDKAIADQERMGFDLEEKDLKKAADFYDKNFVPSRKQQGLPVDDKASTVDFYMEYLKANNPDEYNYNQEKLKSLQDTVSDDKKTGENAEDTKEDQLALERFQAELQSKAFELKTKAYNAKFRVAKYNIENYYKDKVTEFNTLNSDMEKSYGQLSSIQEQLNKYPKNEAGQIVADATNRKEIQTLLDKQKVLVEDFTEKKTRQDEIKKDQDFMDATSLMDDMQNKFQEISQHYYDMATNNPKEFQNLPEYKSLIERKRSAKAKADYIDKNIGTDFGVGSSVGRAITNTISKLAYIPKSLTSNSEYGWTDKLYDITKNNIDDFNDEYVATPTGLDKPLLEDGKWNLKYLPGKVAGGATDMALMVAISRGAGGLTTGVLSGEAAASLGSVVSGYVMTASGYYDEAKAAGMDEKEAVGFSRSLALQQALLELVSPNENLLTPGKVKSEIGDFAKKVATGTSRKEAVLATTKEILKKTVPEVAQENLQLLNELANKYASKELSGELEAARQTVGEQMIETSIVTALTTLGISGKSSIKTRSDMNKQALYMAAYAPDKVAASVSEMLKNGQITDQQAEDVLKKTTIASEALQKIDQGLPVEKQINALVPQVEKMLLQQKESAVDSNFKEGVKQEIAVVDEQIQHVINDLSPDEKISEEIDHLQTIENEIGLEENEKERLNELLTKRKQADEKAQKTNETQVLNDEVKYETDSSDRREPIDLEITTPELKPETAPAVDQVEAINKAETPVDKEEENVLQQTELPSQLPGGSPRKMEFANGEWQQNVGGDLTRVSKGVQEMAQKAFEEGKKPVEPVVKEEKTKEPVSKETVSPAPEKAVSENKSPVQDTQEEKVVSPQENKVASSKKDELLDEEDVEDEKKQEDKETLDKLDKDIEALKQTKDKDKAEAKVTGALYRAYKAKQEGKIKGTTYTAFRNTIQDVAGPKFNINKAKALMHLSLLKDRVKTKLIGEGFKNVALSSPIPITPKQINDLIDVAFGWAEKAIKGGFTIQESVEKALRIIKSNSEYKSFVRNKQLDPKAFDDQFLQEAKERYKEAEKENKPEKPKQKEEKKPEEKEKPAGEEPSFTEGEKKKRKAFKRLEETPEFKNISGITESDIMYDVTKEKLIEDYVTKKVSEFEKDGTLVEVATAMANDEYEFPGFSQGVAYAAMAKKVAERSEMEDVNPAEKEMLMSVAGRLLSKYAEFGRNAGVQSNMQKIGNKLLGAVSSSEALTREAVHQKVKGIQEESLTKDQKDDIEKLKKALEEKNKDFDEAVDSKIAEMSKKILGEEKVKASKDFFASLRNDLKDC